MERKREWVETTSAVERNATVSRKPVNRNGHGPLLWGSIAVIAGYGVTLLGVTTGTALTAFGLLTFIGGAIAWAAGFGVRISYNRRRADAPMPFTAGEKIALIGALLFCVGMVLALATGGEVPAVQVIGVGGMVVALAGVVWHMLTPRK